MRFCDICFYVLLQGGNDKENFDKLVSALKNSKKGKSLGVFIKDNFPGPFMESWKAMLKKQEFEQVSIFCYDRSHA